MPKRLFVSNRDESVRLFKSNFLEYFSHIHPATPVIVYIPVTAVVMYFALQRVSLGTHVLLFLLGVLLWTLLEYLLHRFAFHFHPKSETGQKIHFLFHGVHHDYPRDGTRLVMPLAVSIPLAVLFYFLFLFIFGNTYFLSAFSGLIIGYVCYDTIHYATHHWKMTSPLGKFLKEYHLKHHYIDPDTAYGVSNPLWDFVFFTVPVREKAVEPAE